MRKHIPSKVSQTRRVLNSNVKSQQNHSMDMSYSGNDGGSRTILWCVPRTISSALAKCLSFIDDTEVWFEPYIISLLTRMEYKYYTKEDLPLDYEGNEKVFQKAKEIFDSYAQTSTEADRLPYGSVKRRLEATTAKHVFVKDMGLAMTEEYRHYLPKGYRHTFLIRNPVRSLHSYRKANFQQLSDLGQLKGDAANEKTYDMELHDRFLTPGYFVGEQYDLWKYLKDENIDPYPIVIDGDDLLTKPAETLSAYCAAVGLPYDDSLLRWDASTDTLKKMKASGGNLLIDVINFYGTAMKSSCFFPPSKFPSRDELTDDVIRCSDKVMKYFDEMYESRLKVY